MIIATRHIKDFFLPVIHNEECFDVALDVVKSVSGRQYNHSMNKYIIPIINLNELNTRAAKKKIIVTTDEEVESRYQDYIRWRKLQLEIKKEFSKNLDLDIKLRMPLFPFQTSGVKFMINSKNVINADKVGLGKTVQAIAASEYRLQHDLIDYVFVICPANLRKQWSGKDDTTAGIEAFAYNKSIVIEGTKEQRNKKYDSILRNQDLDVKYIVISYSTLTADMSNDSGLRDVLNFISKKRFYLVLDEAQYIKGYSSKRTESVSEIKDLSGIKGVCGLSATPIELMLGELFVIFQSIDSRIFAGVPTPIK